MDVLLVAISFQILAGTAALFLSKWPYAATALGAGGGLSLLGGLIGLGLICLTIMVINIAFNSRH